MLFVLQATKLCLCAAKTTIFSGMYLAIKEHYSWYFARTMQRRLTIVLSVLLVVGGVVYVADWVQFRIRGRDALGSVPVRVLYAVQQKNGKTEFLIRPPEIETCANSLFVHAGYSPCWYLRRHPERRIQI
jgi:hypothetical protein